MTDQEEVLATHIVTQSKIYSVPRKQLEQINKSKEIWAEGDEQSNK